MEQPIIRDMMTKRIVSVTAETPLVKAVDVLVKNHFSGLPVVDKENNLIGILTEYDLIIKGSSIHLPTFIKLLQRFSVYRLEKDSIRDDVKNILKMKVSDVMNREPLILRETESIEIAVKAFSEHHRVNPILVTNADGKLTGILSRFDLIKLFGAKDIKPSEDSNEREIDINVREFLDQFGRKFVFVSKFRTYNWFIFSLIFALLGFFIAFAIIINIY
jgi:CBS domain-containing protein